MLHLNNYSTPVCPSATDIRPCVLKITQIPAVVSQNVTNKSCLESFRRQVRLLCTEGGEAELRILNSKTACSEFQKPSQTAIEQGKAELRILNFKTTWSQFQKPSQTAVRRGEAELHIYNLKKTLPPQSRSQAVVCVSTTRKYPRSSYFLVFSKKISKKKEILRIF